MIRLLLRSFVLIQSSPKGLWVNVCVCVPTILLSFPYFVSFILFSLFLCLLAAYRPPTNTCKPMQAHLHTATANSQILVHTHTHTHHLQFTVLRMVDGRRGSACSGCQISQCREDILVNELQKYRSHLASTLCVRMYV